MFRRIDKMLQFGKYCRYMYRDVGRKICNEDIKSRDVRLLILYKLLQIYKEKLYLQEKAISLMCGNEKSCKQAARHITISSHVLVNLQYQGEILLDIWGNLGEILLVFSDTGERPSWQVEDLGEQILLFFWKPWGDIFQDILGYWEEILLDM